ncbi:MAG: hypothetical protein SPI65_00490 [Peptoniphilus sp.]|nr:tetratricopeptide repeat protein [Peptoniphilus sp.]MDY3118856.1 hypothetical protein [Peptoniphilus sp.]MDY6044041.1 hypothetical protein [Peptoniphilus sp.]
MEKQYNDFINNLSGDYVEDLNAIYEEVQRLSLVGEAELADRLLNYGQTLMAEHRGEGDDYRSLKQDDAGIDKFYTLLDAVFAKVLDEDMEGAKGFIDRMAEEVNFLKTALDTLDAGESFYSFQSMTEEILCRVERDGDRKPILGPEIDMWLTLRGGVAAELKDYDEAVRYLEKALSVNPMSTANYLTLSKVYRQQGNMETAKEYNHKAFEAAYLASDFSQCFSNEGYFLFKENRPELALAMSMVAKDYDDENDAAEGNLFLIGGRYPDAKPAEKDAFLNYLKDCRIQGTLDPDRVEVLKRVAEKAEEDGNVDFAMDLYINLDAILHDEAIHKKIHELGAYYEDRDTCEDDSCTHHEHDHCCDHTHEHCSHEHDHCGHDHEYHGHEHE